MSDPARPTPPTPPGPSLLIEARRSVRGVFQLMAFKPDWTRYFNPTQPGVVASFAGVALAFPAFWFLIASANFFMAENPASGGAAAFVTPVEMAVIWARFWLLFPLVAFAVCQLMGVRERFFAWLVVHNWTVFVLLHVQALIWALYMAGIANAQLVGALLAFYQIVRLFVHWRVAHGALGLSPGLAAAAAGIVLIVDLIAAAAMV
ncbi:hypothetical protein ACWCOP_12910 [Maricaulaceae bacterium MS644]